MKRYRQLCGVARALDVVGERWSLLIVRELLLGPRRYGELLRDLEGLTTNLLAKRLKDLAAAGVVQRVTDGYGLTEQGRGLEPAVLALGAWGLAHGSSPQDGDRGQPRWAMLALKRRYQQPSGKAVVAMQVGGSSFGLRVGGEALEIADGAPAFSDAQIVLAASDFFAVFRMNADSDATAQIQGDEKAIARFREALGV